MSSTLRDTAPQPGRAAGDRGAVPVPTALIVDRRTGSRASLAPLLQVAGWQVHRAVGHLEGLRQARLLDPDLVVVDDDADAGRAAGLLRRLRAGGSRSRFLVTAAAPTPRLHAEAMRAGALACLAKPLDERVLLDFLRSRTTGPAAEAAPSPVPSPVPSPAPSPARSQRGPDVGGVVDDVNDMDDDLDDVDDGVLRRLRELYARALPERLSAIARGARMGDAPALASAAHHLAGPSGQLGHPEIAAVCQAIARDARRGILAHSRVLQLQGLSRA